MLTDLPQGIPHVKADKLKALTVADDHRAAALPEVPTFTDAGLPQFESKSWYGLLARSGTSPERLVGLHAAFVDALRDPAVNPRFEQAGLDLIGSTPEAFGKRPRSEGAKYAEAARVSGAKLD